jgi:hypothetical protein
MPLGEQKAFIEDKDPNMTYKQKNTQLAAALSSAPNWARKIVQIDRIEIGASGWWITYRVGTPDS